MVKKVKKKKAKKPVKHYESAGAPTKYKPEYCEEIITFFSKEPYTEKAVVKIRKDGTESPLNTLHANDLPFLSAFAREIGVCHETLLEWTKQHKEFSEAYKKAKQLQQEFLVTNGLNNLYAQPFAIFTAKNILGWRDKTQISGDKDNPVGMIVYIPEEDKD